jgi:hypothetical protein
MNPDWLTRAENPRTPEADLHHLVESALTTDADAARPLVLALAANPNLHPDDLLTLLQSRPSSMKTAPDNPAFALHALADPAFFDKVPWALWRRLLNRTEVPGWLLDWLKTHPCLPVALAARWHTSQTSNIDWKMELSTLLPLLPLWDNSMDATGAELPLLADAWRQGTLPLWAGERLASVTEKPRRLATFADDTENRLATWKALLQRASGSPTLARITPKFDQGLTEAELHHLAGGSVWARRLAARHPSASPELLAWLATDALDVRTAVLKNEATPAALKQRITEPASHGYEPVRRLPNPPLPEHSDPLYPVALRIGLGAEYTIAFGASFLLNLPPRRGAATAPDFTVRLHLALTESTSPKTLETLAHDANALVRAASMERLG